MSSPAYSLDTVVSALEQAIYAFVTELANALANVAPTLGNIVGKTLVIGAVVGGLVLVARSAFPRIREMFSGIIGRLPLGG